MDIFEEIKRLGLPLDEYVVVGGASLKARKIRDAHDIDIVVTHALFKNLQHQGWLEDKEYFERWGLRRLKKENIEIHPDMMRNEAGQKIADAIEVMQEADLIEGIPFQNLKSLLLCKKQAVREKDLKDVQLIKEYLKGH